MGATNELSGRSPAMQTLKLLVGAVVAAIFLVAVALSFILTFAAPPLWAVVVLVLLGAGTYALIEAVGYRAAPVPPDLGPQEARQRALAVFRSSLMMRLAAAESVALVGLLLAFVAGQTVLLYDLGAAISVLLLAVHVWPSPRTVDRMVAALESEGANTGLRELLGLREHGTRPSDESG